MTTLSSGTSKDLWILRHGQATHNPRAEEARAAGCSFDEFFELMREDDSLDSPLTELGRQQASAVREVLTNSKSKFELVVSSPLSRALETANLALPPRDDCSASTTVTNRVCHEGFREINGVLKNAQRRSVTQLCEMFPDWNFSCLTSEHDNTWDSNNLEAAEAAAARGLAGLHWVRERAEKSVLLVAHGGLLRHMMEQQHCVVLHDERRHQTRSENANNGRINGKKEEPSVLRPVNARFGNCELRKYRLESKEDNSVIVLTEVDLSSG